MTAKKNRTGILTSDGILLIAALALIAVLFSGLSWLETVREAYGVSFRVDMNGDGLKTISDVGLWLKALFFWPGDTLLALIATFAPNIAVFFEITYDSFGGWMSALLSVIGWIAPFALLGGSQY